MRDFKPIVRRRALATFVMMKALFTGIGYRFQQEMKERQP